MQKYDDILLAFASGGMWSVCDKTGFTYQCIQQLISGVLTKDPRGNQEITLHWLSNQGPVSHGTEINLVKCIDQSQNIPIYGERFFRTQPT